MRTIAVVSLLVVLACAGAWAQEPGKVTLNADGTPLKDVVAQLSQQSGASVVLDPKAEGTVTVSLNDATLSQALDVVTKLNKLSWKKLQFAKPTDETVKLDQIKSAIVALASMPVMGLAVEDPASKTSAVFARDLAAAPKVDDIKLPSGYAWTTVYVILSPEAPAATAASAEGDKTKSISQAQNQIMAQIANLTPEERQQVFANQWIAAMSMAPDIRQGMLRDQIRAMFQLDPQYRDQLRDDFRSAFRGLRPPDGGDGGRGRRRGNQ